MTVQPGLVERTDLCAAPHSPAPAEPAAQPNPDNAGTSASLRRWIAPATMAAGILLGVLLAGSFGLGSDIRAGSGALFAQGNLAQRLAGELSGNGAVGPSFWSREGVFCRVFRAGAGIASGLSGIACREDSGWRIRIVTETNSVSELPGSVRAIMANLIVGTPLDPDAEQQARKQGWRPR